MGEMRSSYKILFGKPEGNRPLGRQGIGGRIILKWISGKFGFRVWIGFIWLMIGSSGSYL
jgi:hypothetical protein